MDDDLYDEFGNYIGGDIESDAESGTQEAANAAKYLAPDTAEDEDATGRELMQIDEEDDDIPQNQIVLHEDKKYYPSAAQVYGEGVETLVQEEDTQPLTEPLVKPNVTKRFTVEDDTLPEVRYDREFMLRSMETLEFVRNIAVVGHLHHGKTAILDMLVEQSHIGLRAPEKGQLRYTDTHDLERQRGMSIKAAPITLMLPNTKGKSLVCNFIDTPGHENFVDEVAVSMRLADGILLVVDAAEGFMPHMQSILHRALSQDMSITVVINKMDRLILELRLPPTDAYFKLKHIIEEVNNSISAYSPDPRYRVSPELGNVCFASASMQWCFSLYTFAKFYADSYKGLLADQFVQRLWGDTYYTPSTRKFTKTSVDSSSVRSFVHFILEPVYKLYSQTLSSEPTDLKWTLEQLGIVLKPSAYKLDSLPLL